VIGPVNALRRVRLGLSLTQTEFARQLGVAEETYRIWDSGRRRAPRRIVYLARRLKETDSGKLAIAGAESRVLLTEDKDFGLLAFASGSQTAGVMLIRFPATALGTLGQAVVNVVSQLGDRLAAAFVVVEHRRARISRLPADPVQSVA